MMPREMLELAMPARAKPSGNYASVIEDADGVVHFWKANGEYDGYDRPGERCDEAVCDAEHNNAERNTA